MNTDNGRKHTLGPVNIGILGLGTVGCGTVNVLTRNADEIARRAGRETIGNVSISLIGVAQSK